MKLVKLHIAHRGACTISHRNPVARRNGRIRRIAVDLSCSSAGQQHRPGPNHAQAAFPIQKSRARDASLFDDQIHAGRPFHQLDAATLCDPLTHMTQQRHCNLPPRRVSIRMQNPRQAVRALARPQQLSRLAVLSTCLTVERRPPSQQLFHAPRPLFHQNRRSLAIHQPIARSHRILQMQRDILVPTHRHGDPTLRISRIRLRQILLRHHQHRTPHPPTESPHSALQFPPRSPENPHDPSLNAT